MRRYSDCRESFRPSRTWAPVPLSSERGPQHRSVNRAPLGPESATGQTRTGQSTTKHLCIPPSGPGLNHHPGVPLKRGLFLIDS